MTHDERREETGPESPGGGEDGDEPTPDPSPATGGTDRQTADDGATVADVFEAALEEDPAGAASVEGGTAVADEPRSGSSLSALYDLTLPVSIELGRASMTVEEVLALDKGSVVELERLAGEPVDIYVGDRHLARGEVVVVREHFGVRVTRLVSPGAGAEEIL